MVSRLISLLLALGFCLPALAEVDSSLLCGTFLSSPQNSLSPQASAYLRLVKHYLQTADGRERRAITSFLLGADVPVNPFNSGLRAIHNQYQSAIESVREKISESDWKMVQSDLRRYVGQLKHESEKRLEKEEATSLVAFIETLGRTDISLNVGTAPTVFEASGRTFMALAIGSMLEVYEVNKEKGIVRIDRYPMDGFSEFSPTMYQWQDRLFIAVTTNAHKLHSFELLQSGKLEMIGSSNISFEEKVYSLPRFFETAGQLFLGLVIKDSTFKRYRFDAQRNRFDWHPPIQLLDKTLSDHAVFFESNARLFFVTRSSENKLLLFEIVKETGIPKLLDEAVNDQKLFYLTVFKSGSNFSLGVGSEDQIEVYPIDVVAGKFTERRQIDKGGQSFASTPAFYEIQNRLFIAAFFRNSGFERFFRIVEVDKDTGRFIVLKDYDSTITRSFDPSFYEMDGEGLLVASPASGDLSLIRVIKKLSKIADIPMKIHGVNLAGPRP